MLRSCHTLPRSCNTKLWLPTDWQFFFHLRFQTVKHCLLNFLTPTTPRPASAALSIMLSCIKETHDCTPHPASCKYVQPERTVSDIGPVCYVLYRHTNLDRSCLYCQYRNQQVHVVGTSGTEQMLKNPCVDFMMHQLAAWDIVGK